MTLQCVEVSHEIFSKKETNNRTVPLGKFLGKSVKVLSFSCVCIITSVHLPWGRHCCSSPSTKVLHGLSVELQAKAILFLLWAVSA